MVTVRVHPAGFVTGEDENGDDVRTPLPPYELAVYAVYPRTSVEPGLANRALVESGRTILAPEGTSISSRDRIDVDLDGKLWDVVGEVRPWDQRSNPLRSRAFRYAPAAFPSLRVGCVEINVEVKDG